MTEREYPFRFADLGNFLSGMETPSFRALVEFEGALGNFLSGMETKSGRRLFRPAADPWKLP